MNDTVRSLLDAPHPAGGRRVRGVSADGERQGNLDGTGAGRAALVPLGGEAVMSAAAGRVRRSVGRAAVPPPLAALVTLAGYHYLDAFTLDFDGADRWTAETWARAMFEDDRPVLVRAATRGLLGAMLGRPGSQERIGGFTIATSEPRVLRADSTSKLSADQVIVTVDATSVSLVTAVRHQAPIARAIWAVLSNLHRSFAPRVLGHAAARIRATDS